MQSNTNGTPCNRPVITKQNNIADVKKATRE
jgi:hypothetical protein